MSTAVERTRIGDLEVIPFAHPQGCRSYLVGDPKTRQAMAIDPHLDQVGEIIETIEAAQWTLPYVVDTHTHADHPSGAGALASRFASTRIAHALAEHVGVTRHPDDGGSLHLGDVEIKVLHAAGHTLDHIVLLSEQALFSGDSVMIGGVARTDFLGGDPGQLFDSLRRILGPLGDDVAIYPGHDYAGRIQSTVGHERVSNPWLRIEDRDEFVTALAANAPPRPANMDDLVRLNREGLEIAKSITAAAAVERVRKGGAGTLIDVRTPFELQNECVEGAVALPLDDLGRRLDEVRAVPAPRLILCRSGKRAELARLQLESAGLGGVSVIEGGILAFALAGGDTVKASQRMSLERQVRVAAGLLAAGGAALGLLLHPMFHAVPLIVGLGLVFAGLTDWCGMGLVLAKMPWNRVAAPAAAASGPVAACAARAPGA